MSRSMDVHIPHVIGHPSFFLSGIDPFPIKSHGNLPFAAREDVCPPALKFIFGQHIASKIESHTFFVLLRNLCDQQALNEPESALLHSAFAGLTHRKELTPKKVLQTRENPVRYSPKCKMSSSSNRKHSTSHRRDDSRQNTGNGASLSSSSLFRVPLEALDDFIGPSHEQEANSWSHDASDGPSRRSSHSGIDRLHQRLPATTISDLSPPRGSKRGSSSKAPKSLPPIKPSSPKDLECQICKKTFYQKINLKRHVREVHQNIRPDEGPTSERRCETCDKVLRHKRSLKSHQAIHDKSAKHIHVCSECGVQFNRKTNRNRHERSVHGRHR